MENLTSRALLLDEQSEQQAHLIRKHRYEIYKQTHNLSLIEITPEEWFFLQRKADLYENLTGKDCFLDMVELYKKNISEAHLLENGRSYARFLIEINRWLKRDCSKENVKLREVNFFTSEHLEDLLGEDAYYNGENVLIKNDEKAQVQYTINKLLNSIIPGQAEAVREWFINGATLKQIAAKKGQSIENIRGLGCRGLRNIRRKAIAYRVVDPLLRDYYYRTNEKTCLLDLEFVEEKNK